jgi:hypothetical protein
MVFVASPSHSLSASSAISSTALKNFPAFVFGLPNGRSLPAVTRTAISSGVQFSSFATCAASNRAGKSFAACVSSSVLLQSDLGSPPAVRVAEALKFEGEPQVSQFRLSVSRPWFVFFLLLKIIKMNVHLKAMSGVAKVLGQRSNRAARSPGCQFPFLGTKFCRQQRLPSVAQYMTATARIAA